jgi:two-component system OmpR family response regulator
MNQLQAMRVFPRVLDLGGFHLAAKQLRMSAAVTRSVGTLEAHRNMRLLNRTTRRLSLPEISKDYLDGCLTKRIGNMAKVLTIDDDELIARDVVRTLSASGLTVDIAHTGREGLAKVMGGDYDLVTLDRILPDLDGLTIVATMRGVGMETPVSVMSAMSKVDQRIQGLRAGADDYLPKPFSSEEMSARVEVLLRRRTRVGKTETMLCQGPLQLDLVRREAKYRERELDLQPTEWRVLEFMMRHAGQILTRTMIFEAVWGCRFDPGTNRIDVHIGRLRKKVHIAGERSMIRTIRGSGYLFG